MARKKKPAATAPPADAAPAEPATPVALPENNGDVGTANLSDDIVAGGKKAPVA